MPGRTPISTRTVTGSGHNTCHQSASGIVVAGKKPTITHKPQKDSLHDLIEPKHIYATGFILMIGTTELISWYRAIDRATASA
jgi:hypothetical protein